MDVVPVNTNPESGPWLQKFCNHLCHGQTEHAEAVWTHDAFAMLRYCREKGWEPYWLQMVDHNLFSLQQADYCFQQLSIAITHDPTNNMMRNARVFWETFVWSAVVKNAWDISRWEEQKRWFKAILLRAWDTGNADNTVYVNTMAEHPSWARDALLEHHVLHSKSTHVSNSMFFHEAGTTLSFTTALAGITLRTKVPFPTRQSIDLHRRAMAAWPLQMQRMESLAYFHALLEGTTVEETAIISHGMELTNNGYALFMPAFGERMHTLLRAHDGAPLPLPPLE